VLQSSPGLSISASALEFCIHYNKSNLIPVTWTRNYSLLNWSIIRQYPDSVISSHSINSKLQDRRKRVISNIRATNELYGFQSVILLCRPIFLVFHILMAFNYVVWVWGGGYGVNEQNCLLKANQEMNSNLVKIQKEHSHIILQILYWEVSNSSFFCFFCKADEVLRYEVRIL
jgi:hypothetical protein